MSQEKYIGMDVHQATVSVAVMDAQGKLIMECLLETEAGTIVQFVRGLPGNVSLTFEEGTSAAWLHDLLKPYVSRLVVCDPRKNALLQDGNKNDRIDARKLAELLLPGQAIPQPRNKSFDPVHHATDIFGEGRITAPKFFQGAHSMCFVIDRLQLVGAI